MLECAGRTDPASRLTFIDRPHGRVRDVPIASSCGKNISQLPCTLFCRSGFYASRERPMLPVAIARLASAITTVCLSCAPSHPAHNRSLMGAPAYTRRAASRIVCAGTPLAFSTSRAVARFGNERLPVGGQRTSASQLAHELLVQQPSVTMTCASGSARRRWCRDAAARCSASTAACAPGRCGADPPRSTSAFHAAAFMCARRTQVTVGRIGTDDHDPQPARQSRSSA